MTLINALAYNETQRPRLQAFMMELQAAGAPGAWQPGDLAWGLFLMSIRFDLTANVRYWQAADGRLKGLAWFNPSDCFLLMQAAPGEDYLAVRANMLAWGRARYAETARGWPVGECPPLNTSVFETDESDQRWLESQGLTCRGRSMVLFRQPLAGGGPAPQVPEGCTVRALAGDHEIGQRAAAHREAFHPSRLTDEHYHRLRRLPEYAPDLDLVAVAADGTVAAFCQCWPDPVNKVGLFEPVGTRPAFQRQGLAKAVLAEGLRRLQALGMERAFVCSNYTNLAAQKLYLALGFNILTYDLDFTAP